MLRYGLMAAGIGFCVAVSGPAFANGYGSPIPPSMGDNTGPMGKALAAIAVKDWSGAIALLNEVAAGDPKNADVQNLLGYSYRMRGEYAQAFLYYGKALAIDPSHKGALEYEGEAYLETNQLPKAAANLSALKAACGAEACPEIAMLDDAINRYKAKAKIN